MSELKWKWAYIPYLDAPEKQKESAIKAGYAKVYFKSEVDAEIESLKASHYAEMVDAGMRERRLRRTLYNACANWAKCEERINNRDAYDASEYLPSAEDKFRKKAERWSEIERKCRAKAEKYK
jgi:myosin heavy subunit